MSYRTLFLAVLVGMLVLPTLAFAQGGGGGGRGNRGGGQGGQGGQGGGGRGNFDPAQMRQRFMDNIKEQMNATEDEWKVISPKLEKVMTAQRETRGGGGFGGRGGRGGNNGDAQDQSKIGQAQSDLRRVLEDKGATAEEISKRLTALREARAKAHEELVAAQKELKELLTQRQEGVCVLMGFLE